MMENYAGRRMDHYLLRGRFGRRWRGSRVWADDEMGRQRDLAATYKLTGSVARRRVRSEGWRLCRGGWGVFFCTRSKRARRRRVRGWVGRHWRSVWREWEAGRAIYDRLAELDLREVRGLTLGRRTWSSLRGRRRPRGYSKKGPRRMRCWGVRQTQGSATAAMEWCRARET